MSLIPLQILTGPLSKSSESVNRSPLTPDRREAIDTRWPIRLAAEKNGETAISNRFPELPAEIAAEAAQLSLQVAKETAGSIATGAEYADFTATLETAQRVVPAAVIERPDTDAPLAPVVTLADRRPQPEPATGHSDAAAMAAQARAYIDQMAA